MGGVKYEIGCINNTVFKIIGGTFLLIDGKKDCGIRTFAKEAVVVVADRKNEEKPEQSGVRKWSLCESLCVILWRENNTEETHYESSFKNQNLDILSLNGN